MTTRIDVEVGGNTHDTDVAVHAEQRHNAVMTVVLTVRDVPDDVRDLLAQEARARGQSMQGFLLSVLKREADFARNRQIIVEISRELHRSGGAAEDAPDAADVLAAARAERHLPDEVPPPRSDRKTT